MLHCTMTDARGSRPIGPSPQLPIKRGAMRSLSNTLSRLQKFKLVQPDVGGATAASGLTALDGFGSNPGNLQAWLHVPPTLPPRPALVVVLHGCTQTAAGYDRGSGWSALADQFGFVVLFAEQQRSNNANLCFNWFEPGDITRSGGEAESIAQMTLAAARQHGVDPARIFVTGLSAGGAMTSVMLATYPELFAGGAIIAGLPYGTAASVPEAFDRMRGHGHDGRTLGDRVRRASRHRGPWPSVAVWHGSIDATVSAVNAAMIVEQWRGLHGAGEPDVVDRVDGQAHRAWHVGGRLVMEDYAIAGMNHGTPITTRGNEAYGTPAPFMLDAGISSTYRIAASWGLVPQVAPARAAAAESIDAAPDTSLAPSVARFDVQSVINGSLRAAGLLKP